MKLRHAFVILFTALALSCTKEAADPVEGPKGVNLEAMESEVLALVNDHRVGRGLSPLAFSEVAYHYANEHNDYMIATGTLSHHNFTARATGIASEADAKAVSENVAKNYATAAQALEGWLASESHRKTMEGDYSHTAVSVKKDTEGNLYYTQLFFLQ
ncbi:CAP domain-containing protein [Robiginitalea marina]|uniref:CAP domain-containing protein n=1 Tax=Robiginitalea marina TaxID=2954105 RepID=A0ABT1AXM4_9FLAO|nr:CAP domain-containing protein [Robiginitalea marina]MCO5724439.1 CAP domain-containing protein [Robiginitalea marina]